MNSDLAHLLRWLRRAQPPRGTLVRALVSGVVASAMNIALLVGALALLVDSAQRPGLRAVAVTLVLLELFAFLRSPLRYRERLAAHQLGYAAVTRWRRWLVSVVGRWDYSQWRTYASGDLLERALRDTDELQDLWLRFFLPFTSTSVVMVLGDVVVALLPPRGGWWAYALFLLAVQLLATGLLVVGIRAQLGRDRVLRGARGRYRAQLVELSGAAPELVLLRRSPFVTERSRLAVRDVEFAERTVRAGRRSSHIVVMVAGATALAGAALHPATSPVWLVVAVAIGLTTFDALKTIRAALLSAVDVSGGGERLDALSSTERPGVTSWPADTTLRLEGVTLREDGRDLVRDATWSIAPGSHVALVGESGAGKSTLLRAMAALDATTSGTITVGSVPLTDLDEDEMRRHVAYVVSEPGLTRGFALDVVNLGRSGPTNPHDLLAALGLESEPTTRFDELSRGERSRVALARALVTRPNIYLLDEPSAGLGLEETRRLLDLLDRQNATIVVATHDETIMAWSDEVVELRGSRLAPLTR